MPNQRSGSGWRRIADAKAAAFLADAGQRRYLEPFLRRDATVAQAALELEVGVQDMYYRVKRMERLGILLVVRVEMRSGRPLKYYSIASDGLFVPFTATGFESLSGMIASMNASFAASFSRHQAAALAASEGVARSDWGFDIYADVAGHAYCSISQMSERGGRDARAALLDPSAPAVMSVWRELSTLLPEDAKALQQRFEDLLREYEARSAASADDVRSRPFMLHLALTPGAIGG